MRILIVYQYYLRDGEGGIGRVNRLVDELRRRGHQITIITGSVNYMTGSSSSRRQASPVYRDSSDNGILRCFIPASYHRNNTGRAVSYALFTLEAIWAGLAHTGGFDVVVASSPPLSTGFVGWLLSHVKRCPWVFEVRDLWPASAIQLGGLRNVVAVWLARLLEKWCYMAAHGIVTLSPAFAPILEQQGAHAGKIRYIPNGVVIPDTVLDRESARSQLSELQGLEDAFVVMYTGAHGLANSLEQVVDAALLLRGRRDIAFVFVGDGMYRESVVRRARDAGLERVRFVEAQEHDRTDLFIQAADLCLISLRNVPVFASVYPSKLADYMRFGRPIIATVQGVASDLIMSAGCGWAVPAGEPEQLARAIDEASRMAHSDLQEAGMRGRLVAQERFSLERVSADYARFLGDVVDKTLRVTCICGSDRERGRRLLILSSRPPFGQDSGFKVRVFNTGQALREGGWSVDILAIDDNSSRSYSAEDLGQSCDRFFAYTAPAATQFLNLVRGLLSRIPMQVWYYRFSRVGRWVRAHSSDYALILANHARMAPYAMLVDVPRILDLHDSIGLNYEREVAVTSSLPWRLSYFLEGRRMARYEAALPAAFDKTIITSTVDKQYIEGHGAQMGRIVVVPVAVRPEALNQREDLAENDEQTCCFIGRMSYAPNVAAVRYFVSEILPLVRNRLPEVELQIIGADPCPAVAALGKQPGVHVLGYVASPYQLIARCSVFIAPMVSGSGVQNKILEALALRRAVVTTPLGAAGIPGLVNGENALLADTADMFADAVVRLMHEPSFRRRLGCNGRSLIESRYTWTTIGADLLSVVESSIANVSSGDGCSETGRIVL